MVDSVHEMAYVPFASVWRVRYRCCQDGPRLVVVPSVLATGTKDATRKGRTMAQKKEKHACKNMARLPARVPGSALCIELGPDAWLSPDTPAGP